MRKLMSVILMASTIMMSSIITMNPANAAEFDDAEMRKRYGDYSILSALPDNALTYTYADNDNIKAAATYSAARGAVTYYESKSGSPTCSAAWAEPITAAEISNYNYFNVWLGNFGGNSGRDMKITLKATGSTTAVDGPDDIRFGTDEHPILIQNMLSSWQWRVFTFELPQDVTVDFQAVEFKMSGGYIMIDDIFLSKKHPDQYYDSLTGVGDYLVNPFDSVSDVSQDPYFNYASISAVNTATKSGAGGDGGRPLEDGSYSDVRKIYAKSGNSTASLTMKQDPWLDLSKYNYVSFWVRSVYDTELHINLRSTQAAGASQNGEKEFLKYSVNLAKDEGNTAAGWKRCSYYIGGPTTEFFALDITIVVSEASIYIDDFMFSERDPLGTYEPPIPEEFSAELEIKQEGEVITGDALEAGDYDIDVLTIGDTTGYDAVKCIIASYVATDDGAAKLDNVIIVDPSSLPAQITVSEGAAIKVFLWDTIEGMTPFKGHSPLENKAESDS